MSGTASARRGDGRYALVLVPALACVLIDQGCKLLLVSLLPMGDSRVVIPGLFNLVHVYNRGAAFGFLNHTEGDWQFWLFLLATLLTALLIFSMTRSSRYSRMLFVGFGLILGGAAGNLLDRVRLRAVIDFLDLYLGGWHWPAFNVADMAICLGSALAALTLWRLADAEKRERHAAD